MARQMAILMRRGITYNAEVWSKDAGDLGSKACRASCNEGDFLNRHTLWDYTK